MKTLGRPTKQDFPEFSSTFKAAHVKVLLHYVADKTYQLCTGSERSRLRTINAWGVADYLHVNDEGRRWLTDEETRRAYYALNAHNLSYQKLAVLAKRANQMLWKERPKRHYMDHTVHIGVVAQLNY